jgi:DNA helicase II / ATP-dependent DNA helicase PcrA
MSPTVQQQAFITALVSSTSHLVLRARAGTGKTTTILQGVAAYHQAHPTHEIVICAFNAAIAKEVKEKIEVAGYDWRKVQGSTIHSLGWGLVRFAFRLTNDDIDDKKVRKLIDGRNEPVFGQFGGQIGQLVRYAKGAGFGFFTDKQIGDKGAWYQLADHFDVNGFDDTSDMDLVVDAAIEIYRASLAQVDVVDYDDMILFPLVKNLRVKFQKDLVIIDEYQDTSPTRQALARKFMKPTGRMVAVGDDRQAIYGFTGADNEALDRFVTHMRADVLPLTVTWRCPQAVVREAQKIVADIQCASDREGLVTSVDHETFSKMELLADDVILCRNTAPLVTMAYSLIRRGIACKVEGRAIGEGLLRLVNRWQVTTVDAFILKLEVYRDREVQKAMAKMNEAKVEEINDRVETLLQVCAAVTARQQTSLGAVREFVTNLFADDVTGVLTLATYHRSKGREWNRVFLLEHSARCPSRAARQAWQQRQEANLAYVAITRAKETLTYVG